jgi:hypothetical protein
MTKPKAEVISTANFRSVLIPLGTKCPKEIVLSSTLKRLHKFQAMNTDQQIKKAAKTSKLGFTKNIAANISASEMNEIKYILRFLNISNPFRNAAYD